MASIEAGSSSATIGRAVFTIAWFAFSIGGSRALAQESPTAGPNDVPPAETTPAEQADQEEARLRFQQGLQLARAGDCGAAIAELTASYALVPRPNTLFNIAQCQQALNRYDLALSAYQQYLAVAPADAEDRAAVLASMQTLENLLGTVVVKSNVEAEIWLADRQIGIAPGTVRVPGGRHVLELRASSHLPARQEVEVAGRQTVEVSFELQLAEQRVEQHQHVEQRFEITKVEQRGLSPAFFWTGVAATGTALAVGSIFGVRALTLSSDAEDTDPRLPRDDMVDDIQNAALLADIFFGAAAAFAVGTTVVFFLTDWEGSDDTEKDATRPALSATPTAGPQAVGMRVEGAF